MSATTKTFRPRTMRPASTWSGTLAGGPTAATAQPERGRHEGQERTDDQDRHSGDLEPLDDAFHGVVVAHLRSPDLAGVDGAAPVEGRGHG